jgi:hypothetical protein
VSPIAFTDEQLDAVIAAGAPLVPIDRGPFLEAIAAALQGREVGHGAVYLAIPAAQRQFREADCRSCGKEGAKGRAPSDLSIETAGGRRGR